MQFLNKCSLLYDLMDSRDKRTLMLLGILSLVNGLFNVVGIASVLPFIGLISVPELLETNKYILIFKDVTGIESYTGVVVAFGTISLFLVIVGNALSAYEVYYGELFGHKKDLELSKKLLRNYLNADVREFEKINAGERAKSILRDVDRVILGTIFSIFQLFSAVLISVFIVLLLLVVDWGVTLVVIGTLTGVYFLIHQFTSVRLDKLGREYAGLESDIYNRVLESLKLQKEIKLNSLSDFFVKRYGMSSGNLIRNRLKHSVIDLVPQYAIEIMAYGVILLIAMYFAISFGPESTSITIIGMYAFAAYRLLPAIDTIFDNMEGILFGSAILEDFVKAFDDSKDSDDRDKPTIALRHSISLSDVSFRFSPDGAFHLDHLNLEFPAGELTCIKGKTGCGKSTVLNLVAGLYQPTSGHICVDGEVLDAYGSKRWKSKIGLVPAVVNLLQASLYENIALGVSFPEIDLQKVRSVAALVDLDEHIMKLGDGYDSVYGENGLNFSSGQILKVGIARALYHDPSLLLLDESTDAFDIDTERLVLERLTALPGVTILLISHRPSVLSHAAKIIDLETEMAETQKR